MDGRVGAELLADPLASARALRRRWDSAREDGGLPSGLRPLIAESWERSQALDVYRDRWMADKGDADFDAESAGRRTFLQAAEGVVEVLVRELDGSDSVVALFDADCRILARHGDRRLLLRTAEQNFLEGVLWPEADCGTNAVGTAVVLGTAFQVFSAEHFCVGWHDYVCSATPIRHPLTGQLLGVLDVTAPAAALNAHMFPLVVRMGAEIERMIAAELKRAARRLLARHFDEPHAATLVVDGAGRPVRAAGPRAELAALRALAQDALAGHAIDAATLVEADGAPVGAIVSLDRERRRPADPEPAGGAAARFGMIGAAAVFIDALRRAERIAASDVAVLVAGEPGTGKTHLARRIAGVTAAELDGLDPGCLEALHAADPLAGAVLLERVDALPEAGQRRLAGFLDRPDSPRVVATAGQRTPRLQIELGLRLQAGTVTLPALRERRADIDALVDAWIEARGRRSAAVPRLTRDARTELRRRSWPGNVGELLSLLDAAAFAATGPNIGAGELPPPLIPAPPAAPPRLIDLERDAIRRALAAAGGDMAGAADMLGTSPATLYRRLQGLR